MNSACWTAYLEGAAEAENAVVGLLGREALDGLENNVGLLWDQVVGSAHTVSLSLPLYHPPHDVQWAVWRRGDPDWHLVSLPQPELSVAGGIGVPVGEGSEKLLEERALEHVGREGWLRHDGDGGWKWWVV